MSRNISEYLHLYYGCDCLYKAPGWKEYNSGTIGPIAMQRMKELPGYDVKPLLRPLSDMTNEEAEHFAWLCMDSEHLEKDCRVSMDEIQIELARNDDGLNLDNDVEIYIGVTCRCFDGYIAIMKDGRIGICEEDEPSTSMKPIEQIAPKIAYLLSKHFDIFNLIEEGLAIDKTKTLTHDIK